VTFGEVVRGYRQRLSVTQEELATRAGLSVRSVRKIEAGAIARPRPATVRLLADAFGLTGAERDGFYDTVAAPAGPPQPLPSQAALVGRDRELATLRERVAALRAGHGRAVLVEGEAGTGKSSLMRVVAAEAAAAGCQVLYAACDELSEAFPLLPLVDCLEPGAGVATTAGTGFDVVAAVTEQLVALLSRRCEAAPLVLVVDDLQWADPATVATLGRLTRLARRLPLLLALTARPVPRGEGLRALRRLIEPDGLLRLDGLADTDVVEFVSRAVGGVPGARLLELARSAGGNPLYLTELVDALARSDALATDDGTVEAVGRPMPDSLAAVINDRLRFLSGPAREVLRVGALLGADFSPAELATVSGRRVNELLPMLDEAIQAGVLIGDGPELTFRHPLIRAALYDGMPSSVRAAWHHDTAKALAEHGARADRVARQLLPALDGAGSVDAWVLRWLVEQSQQLVGYAPHAACRLLRWAQSTTSDDADRELLTCRLADALYRAGDVVEAKEVAVAGLRWAKRTERLIELYWIVAQCLGNEGRSAESFAALDAALAMPDIRPTDQARLLILAARMQRNGGQLEQAEATARQALTVATAAGDRWATAWALGILGITLGTRGQTAAALPPFDEALTIAEHDPALLDLRLMLRVNRAVALGDLDRSDEAIAAAEEVRQLADHFGNLTRLAQAQSVLIELLFDAGRWDDTLAARAAAGTSTNSFVECINHSLAAFILFHRNDAGAHDHLAEAERYAACLDGRMIGGLLLARSLNLEQAGATVDALAVLTGGLFAEDTEQTLELFADAVRLAIAVGDDERARAAVERAEALTEGSDIPHRQAIALHCRGLIERSPALLLRAAEHYHRAGRLFPRAQATEAAGGTHLGRALALYARLGAEWDLARVRAAGEGVGRPVSSTPSPA
jgi:transcriptional regulator with XRE-family HTH domain/tetratricopeptide (TPR) repeat protein